MSRGPDKSTARYFIDAYVASDDAVLLGFAWLVEYTKGGGFLQAGLFVSGQTQVDNLHRVLGHQAANDLRQQKQIRISGVTLELVNPDAPGYLFEGPILGLWVDSEQLHLLDDLRPPAICAIPWSEIDAWKAAWNPVDIITGRTIAPDPQIVSNPVVVEALKSLTAYVNIRTGLNHPNDKAAAVQMFKALQRAGEPFDPSQLRAWATRNGWSSRHAMDLQALGQQVLDFRTVRIQGGDIWRYDVVEAWRRKAAAASPSTPPLIPTSTAASKVPS